ncbi:MULTISPECIES: anhydro-N-acetylmuramic acid kinase [Prauserella salsuginis group]|uniref:Anhydro-N-acetylmuramic acid kinase n=1 Tax=Prauserella salsuginis TaxID=387889 RepID=A0ABW6GC39_9PSEU|nr:MULTISPECIES: anhydro-N-acetylmuramic acid kinase [Prauserella salsuginis group]MCR3719360.1 anhydro-N-acetylmuramic acid kinase [Prauserella flava]MCR3735626.1 anhydro-N-acetylmuramic acid kinase [Prauserella salsuginis]
MSPSLRIAGLLSGTSVDGIDVAIAELAESDGELVLTPCGQWELPYPDELRARLLAALPPAPCSAEELAKLDTHVGQEFADAVSHAEAHAGPVDVVASLGQTVFHWIDEGRALGTLQLGQPAWIAERTGRPVVSDLRVRDVAAGGHGAPLASTLDALLLRTVADRAGSPTVALNIGGISNITVVPPGGSGNNSDDGSGAVGDVLAYDTGPGNALLDLAAAQVTGGAARSDVDGALAAAGTVRTDLLERLLADPYYAAPPPKSTGKEHFHSTYLAAALGGLPQVGDTDLLATLTELTAVTIADACARHGATTVYASGGGVHNPTLMRALGRRLVVHRSDELGLPADAKEAYLTAVLGWLSWHGAAGNVPSATGARGPRVLGSITPGERRLALPTPPTSPISRLRVANSRETR